MMICTGSAGAIQACCVSIVVSGIGLQRISPTTVCQFPQFPVVTICDQTSSTVCSTCSAQHLRDFSIAGTTVWNSLPDNLRDPTVSSVNFGGIWRRRPTCSPDVRSVSALEVLRNALCKSRFTYLVTYSHPLRSRPLKYS